MADLMRKTMNWLMRLPEDQREMFSAAESCTFTRDEPAPAAGRGHGESARACTVNMGTVEAAHYFASQGLRTAALSFAHGFSCGGGFEHCNGSQEEDVFRKTTVVLSLWPHRREDDGPGVFKRGEWIGEFDEALPRREAFYPHTECGGIYSPCVAVVRDLKSGRLLDASDGFPASTFGVITVAAQNLKRPEERPFDRGMLLQKLRTALWMAANAGNEVVVLGAFGCGYFSNPSRDVVNAFRTLTGPGGEFTDAFRHVVFAVPSKYDRANFATFSQAWPCVPVEEVLQETEEGSGAGRATAKPKAKSRANGGGRWSRANRTGSRTGSRPGSREPGASDVSNSTVGTRNSPRLPPAEGSDSEAAAAAPAAGGDVPEEGAAPVPEAGPEEPAAANDMRDIEEKALDALRALPAGSRVALVRMVGSLCPVTLGHVGSFLETRKIMLGLAGARRPARLEHFDACIGAFSLNADGHVRAKLQQKGQQHLNAVDRAHLVRVATRHYDWVGLSRHRALHTHLQQTFPRLSFIQFSLNGADDVAKYRKWTGASKDHRFVTMGRPGDTERVLKGMRQAKIDPEAGFFVMGPELPDISSTRLRTLLTQGERSLEAYAELVDAGVAEWCIEKWARENWAVA